MKLEKKSTCFPIGQKRQRPMNTASNLAEKQNEIRLNTIPFADIYNIYAEVSSQVSIMNDTMS
jgi:hypothetical protein